MRKVILFALILSLLIPISRVVLTVPAEVQAASRSITDARAAVSSPQNGAEKIAPEVQAAMGSLQAGEMVTAIVTLRDQADLSQIPGAERAARQ